MSGPQLNFGGLSEVKSWDWSPSDLAKQIDRFRDRTIKGMTPECFGDADFFGELLFENEMAWKLIYDRPGNILGFWQIIPLDPSGFEMSVKGQICANRIVRELVPVMKPGNWYDAYFFSLSICPTIRKSMIAIQFSGTIIQGLVDMAKSDLFINNLSMCFASSYTLMLNKVFLQFDYCADHPYTGKIYQTHFPTFLKSRVMRISFGKNMKELITLYDQASPMATKPA